MQLLRAFIQIFQLTNLHTTVAYLGHGEKQLPLIPPGETLIHLPGQIAAKPTRMNNYSTWQNIMEKVLICLGRLQNNLPG